jgi:hypothetical protein
MKFSKTFWYYFFFSNIDVELYFHGPGQFLDFSGRMPYRLYRGETMQSQITIGDTHIIERDVTDEEDDLDNKETSKTCTDEVYDDCVYEMMDREMREKTEDNCTVPYMRDVSKVCRKKKDVHMSSLIATSLVTNGEHDCNIPCHSVTVDLAARNYQNTSTENQEYALLDLYFLPTARLTTEKLLYNGLKIFAEIGGYVGLLLGYSLFSLVRWINRAFETMIRKMEGASQYKTK